MGHEERRGSEAMPAQVGALPHVVIVQLLHQGTTVQAAAQIAGRVGAHDQARRVGVLAGAIDRRA